MTEAFRVLGVYAIRNEWGDVYVGQTTDFPARLSRHNGRYVATTAQHGGPWWRIGWQVVADRAEARCIERYWTAAISQRLPVPFVDFKVRDVLPVAHGDHWHARAGGERRVYRSAAAVMREARALPVASFRAPRVVDAAAEAARKRRDLEIAQRLRRLGFCISQVTRKGVVSLFVEVLGEAAWTWNGPWAELPRLKVGVRNREEALAVALAYLERHGVSPCEREAFARARHGAATSAGMRRRRAVSGG